MQTSPIPSSVLVKSDLGLELRVYHAGPGSFHVTSTVISGPTESVVINSGFTRADAHRIAANVLDAGKPLKAIIVSDADPDYYFGTEVLRHVFPNVPVWATKAVIDQIAAKLKTKLEVWVPRMGANAPAQPVVPTEIPGGLCSVDGHTIEVRGSTGLLASRPYLWMPALKAVVGNIAVFGGLHVWTADTKTPEERAAWLAQLDEIEGLQPGLVIPGHMAAGSSLDVGAVRHTRDYLRVFGQEIPKAKDSAALIEAMKRHYPGAGLGIALEIGAKVAKGEMKW